MADVDFRLNLAGVREVFKSKGMQDALMEASLAKAGEANARARATARHALSKDPYEAYTRILSGTAVGGVSTSGPEAHNHEATHHTLSGVNH